MSPSLLVRAASEHDLDFLVHANAAMALETEHKHLDHERLRQGVAAVLADPRRGRYRIAERAGRVAGCLMLTSEWSDWRNGEWWWIQSVYVMPEARRSGVFRALYADVEAAARAAAGVIGLRLYVETANRNAQATYAALGMVDAGYRVMETEFPREVA